MRHFSINPRSVVRAIGSALIAALVTSAARAAEQAPLPDKPFAEHRVVLQQ
jgi:hypothetical protein